MIYGQLFVTKGMEGANNQFCFFIEKNQRSFTWYDSTRNKIVNCDVMSAKGYLRADETSIKLGEIK